MDTYFLKRTDGYYVIRRKTETLGNGLTYTESGNNITITGYTGNNSDVTISDFNDDSYCLARPTEVVPYKLNVANYTYTDDNGIVTLLSYTGEGDADTPVLEEI